MRIGQRRAAAALAVTAIIAAGCMTAVSEKKAEAPSGVQKVSLQAKRFDYTPETITVKKGQPVELSLTALDRVHGFQSPDLNLKTEIWPDKTTVLTFTPDKAGTFELHCDVFCGEGHEGMAGKIIVVE